MTTTDIASFKKKIIEKIKETQKKIVVLEEATKPISPENAIGRISRMDAINNKGVSDAALRIAKRQLNSLQLALTKIDKPEFGSCANCKRPIQPARLMFMPESTLCVNCARWEYFFAKKNRTQALETLHPV